MKATLEIPDDLYRRIKARSALLGRTIKDVTIQLYEGWLRADHSPPPSPSQEEWLRSWLSTADRYMADAPSGPTAREGLDKDRARLDPR